MQMGGKQSLVAVVVVIVIVAAGIWLTRSMRAPGMPAGVAGQMVKKMDYKTMEVVTLPFGKWMELYYGKYNLYKNTKTGEYTMVDVMSCRSCGAEIPVMPVTPEVAKNGPAAAHQAIAEYKCPKCGKSPTPSPGS
jgi:hypothetical protein